MPKYMFNYVVATFFIGLLVLAVFGMIAKVFKKRYSTVETVEAVVCEKYREDTFSKYSGNGIREKYVVVFSAMDKKLSFYVSEFSYNGYKINEKGMLIYKGDQIIDFT